MTHLTTLAILALAASCARATASDDEQIRRKVQILCQAGFTMSFELDEPLVGGQPLDELIHPDDLAAARSERTVEEASELVQKLRPGMRAIMEVAQQHRRCTVTNLSVTGDEASVSVEVAQRLPREEGGIERVAALADLPTHEARVAAVAAWFVPDQTTERVDTQTWPMKRYDGRWVRFYDVAARIAERTREEAVRKAVAEIDALIADEEYDDAAARLKEARALYPDATSLQASARIVDIALQGRIAGKWHLQENNDEMTDDHNVFLALPSTNKVISIGEPRRVPLIARCLRRSIDLLINVGTGIDSDWGELYRATGRYRFAGDKAATIYFGISDSHDAVFFRRPQDWLARIEANEDRELMVEIPTFGHGKQVMKFDLTGARTAFAPLRAACKAR